MLFKVYFVATLVVFVDMEKILIAVIICSFI